MFAGPQGICGSTIPSRSIASMRCGAHSGTSTGRHCTSSMPRGVSDTISSAKASTIGRKWSSNNCWPKLEPAGVGRDLVTVDARGLEAAADWSALKSPENYLGNDRTENFASPGGAVLGQRRSYAVPADLSLNEWALSGEWTVERQASLLGKANGRITSAFTPAIFILSWGRRRAESPCDFACPSMGSRRAPRTEWTSTPRARHSDRAEAVSADPPTEAHRRSAVRD